MPDELDKLSPADPRDLADALAYALRFQGRKRVHNADELMLEIVAKRCAARDGPPLHDNEAGALQMLHKAARGFPSKSIVGALQARFSSGRKVPPG